MANLSLEEILKKISSPKNGDAIRSAVYQEERLTMHCEPIQEKSKLPYNAFFDFTQWWQTLITKEKYYRISQLIGTPLSTTSITKDIFDQLSKFIDAQDRYVEYKFVKKDYTDDYADYLKKCGDEAFWTQTSVEALKTKINSVIVVDLPSVQVSNRPEPYCYYVSPKDWVDIDKNTYRDKIEYIIYKQPNENFNSSHVGISAFNLLLDEGKPLKKVIAIDDTYYRVLVNLDGKLDAKGKEEWVLISESKHGLDYCPVIDFWGIAISETSGLNKKGPISTILRKLNYLLFYRACADYMDLYGPFPLLAMYDEEENEFDEKRADTFQGQTIARDGFSSVDGAQPIANPRTNERSMIGPGSTMKIPRPNSKEDFDLMSDPMKFISMDVDSMKYVDEKIKKYEHEIIKLCTGEDKEYLNEIAKNPEMRNATYERKETILMNIKRQFERAHMFVTKCRAELRYGKEYFRSCTIDYGSDYFLKDSTTITDEFKASKDAGMPSYYSSCLSENAQNTRYKNNVDTLARLRVLSDLEPYKDLSNESLVTLGINVGDNENFLIKINFYTFIKRFELEVNSSIVDFGSLIPYNEKISIIKSKLKDYARELSWKQPIANGSDTKK
jgi:hypothetical protein